MRRRSLLATLSTVLVSGCNRRIASPTTNATTWITTSSDETTRSTTPSDETTRSTTPSDGTTWITTSSDTTAVDASRRFEFGTDVVRSTPSDDGPPRLRIRVTNRAETSHVLTISNHAFPFATPVSDDGGLVLDEEVPATRAGDCWRAVPRRLPMISGHRFAPGETVSGTYAVLNPNDSDDCWPPGEYTFTQTYYRDPQSPNTTDGGTPFDWTFTVTLHDGTTLSR